MARSDGPDSEIPDGEAPGNGASGGSQGRQQDVWTSLGAQDPDWAVLTDPDRRLGGWDGDLTEFYASGVAAIEECLALAEPVSMGRALDYGAGTGRLSFALAARFAGVTSVDISPGMLATLTSRATDAGIDNIAAVTPKELTDSADHDFALSLLVLQHLPSAPAIDTAVGLIAASLKPDARAVIELPEVPLKLRARMQPRFRVYQVLRSIGISHDRLHRAGFSGISMRCVSANDARAMFARHGLVVLARKVRPDHDYDYVRWVLRRG